MNKPYKKDASHPSSAPKRPHTPQPYRKDARPEDGASRSPSYRNDSRSEDSAPRSHSYRKDARPEDGASRSHSYRKDTPSDSSAPRSYSSSQRPRSQQSYGSDARSDERGQRPSPSSQRPRPQQSFRKDTRPEEDSAPAPMLPGIKPVLELLQTTPERVDCVFFRKGRHGQDSDAIIDLCKEHKIRFSLLETSSFARVYEGSSQGVVARLFETGFADYSDLLDTVMDAPLPLLLALDQVQDPGNAGTLARTMYALGGAGMAIPKHNGVYLGAAATKAAAGALEKLPVAKVSNLGSAIDTARKMGFTIYGAASKEEQTDTPPSTGKKYNEPVVANVFSFTPRFPAILLLGAEESGLRTMIEKRCDVFLSIPMLRDFDSLNVAQAGAIIIAEFSKHIQEKK